MVLQRNRNLKAFLPRKIGEDCQTRVNAFTNAIYPYHGFFWDILCCLSHTVSVQFLANCQQGVELALDMKYSLFLYFRYRIHFFTAAPCCHMNKGEFSFHFAWPYFQPEAFNWPCHFRFRKRAVVGLLPYPLLQFWWFSLMQPKQALECTKAIEIAATSCHAKKRQFHVLHKLDLEKLFIARFRFKIFWMHYMNSWITLKKLQLYLSEN